MNIRSFILSFFLTTSLFSQIPECPFHCGFNLAGWFEKGSATQVQLMQFSKEDLEDIQSLGCDHIRLPIHLFNMSGDAPDHVLNPIFLNMLDQVVDWAEELGLQLILDNHSFDPAIDTDPAILDQLIVVWQQMAEHYKNRSALIYYEILNEPHGINDATWNAMQQQVIETIRLIDTTHTLIIGPAGWNSYNNLAQMPEYTDEKLIATFHFYDPFLFTHQGADWTGPSMVDIAGIPFPYDAARMPEISDNFQGTWIEDETANYPDEGNPAFIQSKLDIAIAFRAQTGLPIYCGEFGAYQVGSTTEDRARWTEAVTTILDSNKIAWSMWEYRGGFGVFKPNTGILFDSDLNIPIIEALGLTSPPQVPFEIVPDTTGMVLYNDYLQPQVIEASWESGGLINYYFSDGTQSDDYMIYWTGYDQYGALGWRFSPTRDFSLLEQNDYKLRFRMKCADANLKIDIRFLDTDLDIPEDHPWRMNWTLDATKAHLDGEWEWIEIPFDEMAEMGSWDNNTWYDPVGEFDWTAIDMLQFVAEHHSLEGIDIYLDDIKIVGSDSVSVAFQPGLMQPVTFTLQAAYPNPFNPRTLLTYSLPADGQVKLILHNLQGRQVMMLKNETEKAGQHTCIVDGTRLTSGVYLATLKWENRIKTQKLMLIK